MSSGHGTVSIGCGTSTPIRCAVLYPGWTGAPQPRLVEAAEDCVLRWLKALFLPNSEELVDQRGQLTRHIVVLQYSPRWNGH